MHGLPVVIFLVVAGDLTSTLADILLLLVELLPSIISSRLSKDVLIVSMVIIGVKSFPLCSIFGELVSFVFPILLKINKVLEVDIIEHIESVFCLEITVSVELLIICKLDIAGHCLSLPLSRSVDHVFEELLVVSGGGSHQSSEADNLCFVLLSFGGNVLLE